MKKLLKNKKGITLVELLAVIVILGIVAAIAVPAIGGIIQESKVKADAASESMIKEAAYLWAVTTEVTASGSTTVDALVTAGYLAGAVDSQVTPTKEFTTVTYTVTGGVVKITGVTLADK